MGFSCHVTIPVPDIVWSVSLIPLSPDLHRASTVTVSMGWDVGVIFGWLTSFEAGPSKEA